MLRPTINKVRLIVLLQIHRYLAVKQYVHNTIILENVLNDLSLMNLEGIQTIRIVQTVLDVLLNFRLKNVDIGCNFSRDPPQ